MEDFVAESGKKQMVFKTKGGPEQQESRPLGPPWKILVIDDDRQIHYLTEEVLRGFTFEKRPLQLISGFSGREAIELIRQHQDAAAILLDVIMETNYSGLDIVKFIREEMNNRRLRILLRTGQAGQFPEEKIFEEYDINNFLEKADLTIRRLKTAIKVSLRAHRDMCELDLARMREVELRKAADAASLAKTQFLHMMSHELRTPLQGTKGPFEEFKSQFHLFSGMKELYRLTGALEDDSLKRRFSAVLDDVRGEVEAIAAQGLKSVEHLLGLIEDILDLARIEAGKLHLDIAPHRVFAAIEEVVVAVRPLVEKNGLTLETDLGSQDVEVLADRKRFKQILFNLLGNAIKFTVRGRIVLSLVRNDRELCFRIEDSGIGIPPEQLETIFEPFVQVDNSATRNVGGTGLGLPITRELVRRMGGELGVQSTLGQGSVFSFTLPLAEHELGVA
ncbi:MAG: hypothetical protein HQL84_12300 [Magnetococcales bacterium]|nr:hypothetical protein [Magnetococcales bacterium]MBF0150815.1 hypothetical protein [Magnetococcales bacterium]MBF0172337.1 hypothetical protein [Magnetococcales bacterium]